MGDYDELSAMIAERQVPAFSWSSQCAAESSFDSQCEGRVFLDVLFDFDLSMEQFNS